MKQSIFTNLPFDQFSRQEIVRQLVESSIRPFVKESEGRSKLSIIDLGGHKGHTQDFFPNDKVVILDVFDEKYPGYIKGDATSTNFKNEEFDLVVSFDTFEHIPKSKREAFVLEAARISKHGFIIAAPFDNARKEISFAEKEANDLYKKIKGTDHPWLSEHINYGIPTVDMVESYIKKTNSDFVRIPTNNLHLWLMTQGVMFNATLIKSDVKEVVDVSRFYNLHLNDLEGVLHESYRQIYVGSKNKQVIENITANRVADKDKTFQATLEYISKINDAYASILKRLSDDRTYLKTRERHLQEEYDRAVRDKTMIEKEFTKLKAEFDNSKSTFTGKIYSLSKRLRKK